MQSKREEQIGQLPSFSDLEPNNMDVNALVTPSVKTLMTIVLGIIQNAVLTNQIILELRTFAERCKNDSNLTELHFQNRFLKQIVGDELKFMHV